MRNVKVKGYLTMEGHWILHYTIRSTGYSLSKMHQQRMIVNALLKVII